MTDDPRVEAAAQAICECRGFGYYTDPMEGGQYAYDISTEARLEAEAALAAADRVSPDTAAAVAAERERCAKIAERFEDYTGAGSEDENSLIGTFARGNRNARRNIAAAIRKGDGA